MSADEPVEMDQETFQVMRAMAGLAKGAVNLSTEQRVLAAFVAAFYIVGTEGAPRTPTSDLIRIAADLTRRTFDIDADADLQDVADSGR